MITDNPPTRRERLFYFISLGLIALAGLGVIAGWHLRISAFVKILPNSIPMQYNTALCFIVLAISAAGAVLKSVPKIVSAVGAMLVSVFGALVIYQYLANDTIGIDTFFFYPWDQTLSADPGRMAFTTAFCFWIAGLALTLSIFNPRALVACAIAHTLPLSLGLTSIMGYIFGIRYVLPFRLGSQMAVHTAAAFIIYSGVVLYYAWQHIPKNREGLPRWTPGIAVVITPVIFVAFNSAFSGSTLTAKIYQILLTLSGTALLAYAVHRIIQTRIVYKGIILIAIPLTFVLGFVILVSQQRNTNETAQSSAMHSQEVIQQVNLLSEQLTHAESDLRGLMMTSDNKFLIQYEQAKENIPFHLNELKSLTLDNPAQHERAIKIGEKAEEKLTLLEATALSFKTGTINETENRLNVEKSHRLTEEFRRQYREFLVEENKLDKSRRESLQNSWQRLDWLLVAGTSADLLLALTIALLFTKGISSRLGILKENAKSLADGKSLAEPLVGTDEIAQLDAVFHRMAQALHKAQEELESKVIERTLALSDTNELLKTEMRERELAEEALRQSEEKLRQTQKLESIGLLAGGVR